MQRSIKKFLKYHQLVATTMFPSSLFATKCAAFVVVVLAACAQGHPSGATSCVGEEYQCNYVDHSTKNNGEEPHSSWGDILNWDSWWGFVNCCVRREKLETASGVPSSVGEHPIEEGTTAGVKSFLPQSGVPSPAGVKSFLPQSGVPSSVGCPSLTVGSESSEQAKTFPSARRSKRRRLFLAPSPSTLSLKIQSPSGEELVAACTVSSEEKDRLFWRKKMFISAPGPVDWTRFDFETLNVKKLVTVPKTL